MSQYSAHNARPKVYTDGACENNGKPNARGGIGVYWGKHDRRNLSEALEGRQTNQRAEIRAAVRALEQAREQQFDELTIFTDSHYLIHGVTDWKKIWLRNGWRNANGEPVENRKDFEDFYAAEVGIDVDMKYVEAHSGDEGNDAADQLARQGIEKHLKMANNCATGSGTSKKFKNDRPFIKVKIGNLTHLALVATGSARCVIGEHLFEKTGYSRNSIQKMEDNVPQDIVGNSYEPIGQVMFKVEWANQVTEVPFIVVPKEIEDLVLGHSFLRISGLSIYCGRRKLIHDELGIVIPYEFVEVSNVINLNYLFI